MNLTAPDPALMTWKLKGADLTATSYVRIYNRSLYAKSKCFRLPFFSSYSVSCTGAGPEDRGAGAGALDPDAHRGAVGRPPSSGTGGLDLVVAFWNTNTTLCFPTVVRCWLGSFLTLTAFVDSFRGDGIGPPGVTF